MAQLNLTSPEGKIVRWRIENTPLSPIVLGMCSFLALLAVGYVFQPTRPWLMWAGPCALGVGVFLYAFGKAIDRLKYALEIIEKGATSGATGMRAPEGFQAERAWTVETPLGVQYELVASKDVEDHALCYIDGLKLFDQWVGGQVTRQKVPPPFLHEMRAMPHLKQSRRELSNGAMVPVVKMDHDRMHIVENLDVLYALLGDGVPAFPVVAYDEFSRGRLEKWAEI